MLNRIATSDDAAQVVLAALLALPVSGMIQVALGWPGSQLPRPGGVAAAATLFVLLVPALAGACLGAGARRRQRRAR